MSVLLCGGIAGVVTWATVFPLGTTRVYGTRQDSTDILQRRDQDKSADSRHT